MERVQRMLLHGATDEQVSIVFGVHRTTIGRLRRQMDAGDHSIGRPDALTAFMRMVRDAGPCDDEHLSEYVANRDAARKAWRREYFPQ
jgi:hypothetical protein